MSGKVVITMKGLLMQDATSSTRIDTETLALVASQFKTPIDRISADTQFATDLAADSLSVVELIFAAEKALGIKIPEEITPVLETVGDLIALLKQFSVASA